MRSVVAWRMPQESSQIVQSVAQDTMLHYVDIFGEIERVSPPVLGDKFATELGCFAPRASIRHQDIGCQGSDKTVSVLG
jgi:hypothetical protein